MRRHLTRLCLDVTFKYHKLHNFVSKDDIFFVKREMLILSPVTCDRTNFFSVKRDLDPPSPFTTLLNLLLRADYIDYVCSFSVSVLIGWVRWRERQREESFWRNLCLFCKNDSVSDQPSKVSLLNAGAYRNALKELLRGTKMLLSGCSLKLS